MSNKTISVWLKNESGKIVLQKRNVNNKRFANVYQATWAGKVEDIETVEGAVERECEEELGRDFANKFDFSKLKSLENSEFMIDGKKWECFNLLGEINNKELKNAKIHSGAFENFFFADEKNFNEFVMFDDQKNILRKIIKSGFPLSRE